MTQDVKIIVGANFGDEGKGLVTDYYAHNTLHPLVIRHNGGSQAGHTVVTPSGNRHVFNHLGSGSFNYAPTYLSQYFITNPITFLKEFRALNGNPITVPTVYADVNSPLTTFYDMYINQTVERLRGNSRHGSCGLGIGETMERLEQSADQPYLSTKVRDLLFPDLLREKLIYIRDKYIDKRLAQLGIVDTDSEDRELYMSDKMMDAYLNECDIMRLYLEIVLDSDFAKDFDTLIFEGAQGLLLDEDHFWFPHVTRSKTGVRNAVKILETLDIKHADVHYVTRTYLTRHGAGPLPFEVTSLYDGLIDETNFTNEYQGRLRFAPLNLDLLRASIQNDHKRVKTMELAPHLVVTCLDQIEFDMVRYVDEDVMKTNNTKVVLEKLSKVYNFKSIRYSYGPTREHIR